MCVTSLTPAREGFNYSITEIMSCKFISEYRLQIESYYFLHILFQTVAKSATSFSRKAKFEFPAAMKY